MENEKMNNQPEGSDWLDELLNTPDPDLDIAPADAAEDDTWLDALLSESAPEAENVLAEAAAESVSEVPAEIAAEPISEVPAETAEAPVGEAPAETGEDNWLDDLLVAPELETEIVADEQAVAAAGLSDISEMELEKIIQEAIAENWEKDDPYSDTAAQQSPLVDPAFGELFAELEESHSEPSHAAVSDMVYEDDDDGEEQEEAAEISAEEDAPVRKVRPRRKKGYGLFGLPHLASTAIWAAIILAIGISFGRLLWVCAADILAFGREDKTITITITETDDLDSIANKLYNAGLIKYPSLFKFYAELADVMEEGKISVGTFELNTLFDYNALVKGMSANSSYRDTIEVIIPEGYTCKQIFALLEEKGVCTVQALETYASENEFSSYWFLEGIEKGTPYCLEGFLFPDTYEFYTNSTPRQVYIKLLGRFEDQFDEDLINYMNALNERLSMKLTVNDIITIASMIEKESAHTGENYNVSSVIYNRLTHPADFPYLQIDATVVYALGGKNDLTSEDLKIDSPYNTYLYSGLPPTPISNPGISAIYAALSPAETNYYYYALDPSTNEHHFSETYKEHEKFLESLKKD